MNKTPLIILSTMCLTLCGCGARTAVNVDVIPWNVRDAEPNEVFSTVELIPLEFDGNNYPNSVSDLRVEDNRIFIADNHNTVYVFSDSGAYYGCSNNMLGAGPEEYAVSMGFSWNPHAECVELLTPTEMLSYDDHFTKLISKAKLPGELGETGLLFNKIYDLSSSRHLIMPTGVGKDPFRVFVYDSEAEKIYGHENEASIGGNVGRRRNSLI